MKLFFERNGKTIFWSVKNSGEILNKLKSKEFLPSSVSGALAALLFSGAKLFVHFGRGHYEEQFY